MRYIASKSWNGTGDTRSCRTMPASLLNARYVAIPIRAIDANAPYQGSCFPIQVQIYFRIGVY